MVNESVGDGVMRFVGEDADEDECWSVCRDMGRDGSTAEEVEGVLKRRRRTIKTGVSVA